MRLQSFVLTFSSCSVLVFDLPNEIQFLLYFPHERNLQLHCVVMHFFDTAIFHFCKAHNVKLPLIIYVKESVIFLSLLPPLQQVHSGSKSSTRENCGKSMKGKEMEVCESQVSCYSAQEEEDGARYAERECLAGDKKFCEYLISGWINHRCQRY